MKATLHIFSAKAERHIMKIRAKRGKPIADIPFQAGDVVVDKHWIYVVERIAELDKGNSILIHLSRVNEDGTLGTIHKRSYPKESCWRSGFKVIPFQGDPPANTRPQHAIRD